MGTNTARCLVLAVGLLAPMFWGIPAVRAEPWTITQLTTDPAYSNKEAAISDRYIAWARNDVNFGGKHDVMVYDRTTAAIQNLTAGSILDASAISASGDKLFWRGASSNSADVFQFNAAVLSNLTNYASGEFAGSPALNGTTLAWGTWLAPRQINLRDVNTGVQTSTTTPSVVPTPLAVNTGGQDVLYIGRQGFNFQTSDIYLYNGQSHVKLTATGSENSSAIGLSDRYALWAGILDNRRLRLYDLQTSTSQLISTVSVADFAVFGDYVAWEQTNPAQVIIYNLKTQAKNTLSGFESTQNLKINDTYAVFEGSTANSGGVYAYNIQSHVLSNLGPGIMPSVYGNTVTWTAFNQLYMAVAPEPATLALLAWAGLLLRRRPAR